MNMEINLSVGMWPETVGKSSLAPRVMAPKIVRPPSRARKVTTVEPRVTRSLTRASGSSHITSTQRSPTAGSGLEATARFAFGDWVKRLRKQSCAVTVDLVAAAVVASTKNEADGEGELTDDSSDDGLEIGKSEILETLERPRKRRALSSARGPTGGGGSLVQDAVRPQMQERYRLYASAFLLWSGMGSLAGSKADVIDQKLVSYFEYLFAAGHNPYVGYVTLASLSHNHPPLGHGNRSQLFRAQRALKGWKRLVPPRSRVAEAWPVLAGLITVLLDRGLLAMAVWCIVCFGLYTRPSECMRLRGRDLIPPQASLSTCWTFLLNPQSMGVGSKTGENDESLIWDPKGLEWMNEIFRHLKASVNPDECLWTFAYPALLKEVKAAAARLEVPVVPYLFRHCGPSWDILKRNRSLPDVQKRMRVRSARAVARYDKSAATLALFDSYQASKMQYFDECDKNLK